MADEIFTPIMDIDEEVLEELPDDEDLKRLIKIWENESKPYNEEIKKEQDLCEEYYKGNQTKRERVPLYLSNHVTNRIFEAVETAVPIVTAKPPEFIALPVQDDEDAILLAEDTQKVLSELFDKLDIREKLETCVRHLLMFRFGVLKPFWNEKLQDVDVKYIRPQLIYMPKYGQTVYELPYILEKQSYTIQDLKEAFGEDVMEKFDVQKDKFTKSGEPGKLIDVYEVWTNEWVAWKSGNSILKKEKNTYFDFKNESNNYFEHPLKPYIFLTSFAYTKGMVSSPSMVAQSVPLQDAININIRKIIDHIVKMGNGAWLVDSETMTYEEATEKINNAAGIILYGKGVARQDMIRRDAPTPLPNHFFAMLNSLNAQFDNLFGLHSTTRGERAAQETATGRQLLKQADLGRLDAFVRITERAIDDLGAYFMQLMKLFYDKDHVFPVLTAEGAMRFIRFKGTDIHKGMKVKVRHGSTLPTDPEIESQRAIQLWQLGALDPITLYKKLNYPNPEATAEQLNKWKTGQLFGQPQLPMPAAGVEAAQTQSPLIGG